MAGVGGIIRDHGGVLMAAYSGTMKATHPLEVDNGGPTCIALGASAPTIPEKTP